MLLPVLAQLHRRKIFCQCIVSTPPSPIVGFGRCAHELFRRLTPGVPPFSPDERNISEFKNSTEHDELKPRTEAQIAAGTDVSRTLS